MNPSNNREETIQSEQQAEDLDLRVKRQVYLSMQLQKQLSLVRSQSQYCLSFLSILKEEHEKMKKHHLFSKSNPFGGWQSKLKQLSVSAISNESYPQTKTQQKSSKKDIPKAFCNQKDHLFQILSEKERQSEVNQIRILELKLNSLYSKISNLVMQEYLNDKIFHKIKRQAKRQGKIKTLAFLEKEISKYQNWVKDNQSKLESQLISKQIEENIVHNLEQMKLIMSKKIINNDYVFENFEEKGEQSFRKIDKIGDVSSKTMEKYKNSLNFFKTKEIQLASSQQCQNFEKTTTKTKNQPFNLKDLETYLEQVHETVFNLDYYPLQKQLSQQCKLLENKLEFMTQALKK